MRFSVTVLIDGVATWVPNSDGSSLCVLFPDPELVLGNQQRPPKLGRVSGQAQAVEPHDAVLQLDEGVPIAPGNLPKRQVSGTNRQTFDLSGHWVGWQSRGGCEPFQMVGDLGIWQAQEVFSAPAIKEYWEFRQDVLPGGGAATGALKAGVVITEGEVGASGRCKALWKLYNLGGPGQLKARSSVVKVELGRVDGLDLLLAPLDGGPEQRIALEPAPGEHELTIRLRHQCDVSTDVGREGALLPSSPDEDFSMNYLLYERSQELIQQKSDKLPYPSPEDKSGNSCYCTGDCEMAYAFTVPFQLSGRV